MGHEEERKKCASMEEIMETKAFLRKISLWHDIDMKQIFMLSYWDLGSIVSFLLKFDLFPDFIKKTQNFMWNLEMVDH